MTRVRSNALVPGLALALGIAMPVAAQSPGEATARGMVGTLVDGMVLGAEQGGLSPESMPEFLSCMEEGASDELVPIVQRLLEQAFTAEELDTLDAHFASPLAALSRRATIEKLRIEYGATVDAPVTLTAEQRAALDAFGATPLGERVWSVGFTDDQPDPQMKSAAMSLLDKCHG